MRDAGAKAQPPSLDDVLAARPHMFVRRGFLDEEACARVRRAMNAGVPEPADVLGEDISTDREVRRASHVEVDPDALRLIEERLDAVRDEVSAFFGIPLSEREGTSFLRYPPGGFFKRHRDWGQVPSWPGAARRQISVVVFLNTSTDADPSGLFSGGTLTLIPDAAGAPPVPVHARAGTLVAFPSVTLHEVTPVHAGIRDSVVDWFY